MGKKLRLFTHQVQKILIQNTIIIGRGDSALGGIGLHMYLKYPLQEATPGEV